MLDGMSWYAKILCVVEGDRCVRLRGLTYFWGTHLELEDGIQKFRGQHTFRRGILLFNYKSLVWYRYKRP